MSTEQQQPTPEPDPTDYPDSWKPSWVKQREQQEAQQREALETHIRALSDEDLERIRKGC